MANTTLIEFAKSMYWDVLKDEVLRPSLNRLADVREEIETELDITPEKAYIGKMLASKELERIIESIDILSRRNFTQDPKDSLE